jgi:hypothetical protein
MRTGLLAATIRSKGGAVKGGAAFEPLGSGRRRRIVVLPTTREGTWAAWLALGYLVGMLAWMVLPGGAGLGFLAGIAGGVLALLAIVRRHERAVLVFVAVLPLLLVVAFVLAELLVGHD